MWEGALTMKEDKSITEGRDRRKAELAEFHVKALSKGVNRIIVQSDLSYNATVVTTSKAGLTKSVKIAPQEIIAFEVPDGAYRQYFTLETDPKTRHPISMEPNNPMTKFNPVQLAENSILTVTLAIEGARTFPGK
jgi:hypothetical protein